MNAREGPPFIKKERRRVVKLAASTWIGDHDRCVKSDINEQEDVRVLIPTT